MKVLFYAALPGTRKKEIVLNGFSLRPLVLLIRLLLRCRSVYCVYGTIEGGGERSARR